MHQNYIIKENTKTDIPVCKEPEASAQYIQYSYWNAIWVLVGIMTIFNAILSNKVGKYETHLHVLYISLWAGT